MYTREEVTTAIRMTGLASNVEFVALKSALQPLNISGIYSRPAIDIMTKYLTQPEIFDGTLSALIILYNELVRMDNPHIRVYDVYAHVYNSDILKPVRAAAGIAASRNNEPETDIVLELMILIKMYS